jgi:hypothetical protein
MKKSRLPVLFLIIFLGIISLKVHTYASEGGHTTIPSQPTEDTGEKTELIDNKVDTSLINNNVPKKTISDPPSGPSLSNSFISQRYWLGKIPNEIIPEKMKGYILQAINSFTIFAALILVIALSAMALSATDEQKLRYTKNAVKILLTSIIVVNLLVPIIHLGLWMAGAL